MPRHIRTVELLTGVEGLALLRHLHDGDEGSAEDRLSEIRALLDDETLRDGEVTSELDPRAGYDAWAESYEAPGNPIVELEQSIVWPRLEAADPGEALDAACGTGRHARCLADLGHQVTALDGSPEMLARAAEAVPEARCIAGDLRAIPLPDASFDLIVCALALAHLPELSEPAGELARVLKPGGRLIVSVLHPVLTHLGWHARFTDGDGQRHFVREHRHTHGDYLRAFASAGLRVLDCVEPALRPSDVRAQRRAFSHIPEALESAYSGLPAVLVWEFEPASVHGSGDGGGGRGDGSGGGDGG